MLVTADSVICRSCISGELSISSTSRRVEIRLAAIRISTNRNFQELDNRINRVSIFLLWLLLDIVLQ
jgi:hypothetical protein